MTALGSATMQHILAPGFFFLLLALSQLVQASPTDQDLARILAEAEEAVNSKLTKATVAGAQSRRKLLGRKVTHE